MSIVIHDFSTVCIKDVYYMNALNMWAIHQPVYVQGV